MDESVFTIHAGEFVAGDFLEKKFRNVNVWVPSKDSGIDLLVTDKTNKRTVSLQVKFSRDFLATHMHAVFQRPLRACGWWSLNRKKIAGSNADYWVFVLVGFERQSTDFVIVKPSELLKRLDSIHAGINRIQSYIWVTQKGKCWETRGLKKKEQLEIAYGTYRNQARNFSAFLNNWSVIQKLNGK